MSAESTYTRNRISAIHLDEATIVRRNADIEHERKVAMVDLLDDNRFTLKDGAEGPYHVTLRIAENRLVFDVANEDDQLLRHIRLLLTPFRALIRDYFIVCESYFDAIKTASPSQIEAIDMGRRGLHNEGSEMLLERLKDSIDLDLDTARRLFTLMCVLHIRG